MKRILLILSLFIVFTSCNDLSQNSSQPTNQTAQSESLKEPDDQPQIEPSKDNEPKEQDVEEQKKPVTINKDEYEIKEIHKGGDNSLTHYVIVFIGDGFTKDEWNKEENKHKTFYGHIDLVKTVLFGGTVDRINYKGLEPFKSYKDYIDIYAIATISKGKKLEDRYIGITGVGLGGYEKITALEDKVKQEYSVQTINITHAVVNETVNYGRSLLQRYSVSSVTNANATIHEMGHSIGGLGDEYQPNKLDGLPNVSQASEQDVPWKTLNGFEGTGTVHSEHSSSFWIPTRDCMMSQNTDAGHFCEVCKYALATRMSSVITGEDIKMYDTESLDKVKDYDTYSKLKEHLRKNGKQNEQKQEAQNNNTRAVFPSK